MIFDGSGPRSPEPEAGKIYNLSNPDFPEFIFEWHPISKNVYVGRLGVRPVIGEKIAMSVTDHGAAQNCVLIWLRGYKTAKLEMTAPGEHVPGLAE
jgi:hypothetical protein